MIGRSFFTVDTDTPTTVQEPSTIHINVTLRHVTGATI